MYNVSQPCFHRFTFDGFEVDPQAGELRLDGQGVPIQDIPFRFLVALLEHPGEIVGRETLRQRIWPAEVNLDFEMALDTAAHKVRKALGESAKSAKYLETHPGKGYRFLQEVTIVQDGAAVERVPGPEPESPARDAGRRWMLLAGACVAILATAALGFWKGHPGPAPITSLAVLPLQNFTGDKEQDLFVDGMTDAIITDLAQIKALKVISRTSVMVYKGSSKTLPQIARELGVQGVLEGSVMRVGDKVRITAQFLDGPQDRHLWASSYEKECTNLLALQREVANDIAAQIRIQVTPQEHLRLAAQRPVDPWVYETTLRAKDRFEHAIREAEIRGAIAMYREALARAPDHAPAWAGLAEATWGLTAGGWEFVAPGEVREQAVAAAEKALALDPDLPEAHLARAEIALDGEWDLAKAQLHYEKALEIRPGYAFCHLCYSQMLANLLKDFKGADRHFAQARDLDPLSPLVAATRLQILGQTGQHRLVLEEGERLFQLQPWNWGLPRLMGFSALTLGRMPEAVTDFEASARLGERSFQILGPLGYAYGRVGRVQDARKLLAECEVAERAHYVSPVWKAWILVGLGREAEAYHELERALDQRSTTLLWSCLQGDVRSFDGHLKDPRWPGLKRRIYAAIRFPGDQGQQGRQAFQPARTRM